MKALLEQPNGLARRILSKAGLNPTQVGGGGALVDGLRWMGGRVGMHVRVCAREGGTCKWASGLVHECGAPATATLGTISLPTLERTPAS